MKKFVTAEEEAQVVVTARVEHVCANKGGVEKHVIVGYHLTIVIQHIRIVMVTGACVKMESTATV